MARLLPFQLVLGILLCSSHTGAKRAEVSNFNNVHLYQLSKKLLRICSRLATNICKTALEHEPYTDIS